MHPVAQYTASCSASYAASWAASCAAEDAMDCFASVVGYFALLESALSEGQLGAEFLRFFPKRFIVGLL